MPPRPQPLNDMYECRLGYKYSICNDRTGLNYFTCIINQSNYSLRILDGKMQIDQINITANEDR